MDATVIEEIANQLGMAVDTAAQFIADILPKYAGLMVWERTMPCVLLAVLFVICIIACVKYAKWALKKWPEATIDDQEAIVILSIGAAITLVFITLLLMHNITVMGSWHLFPEAMLLDMALERVA